MVTVMTPDGQTTLITVRDMHEVCEKYVSDEFASAVTDYVECAIWEANDELEGLKQEFQSYEMSCEEFQSTLIDARDAIDEVIDLIDESKRLNRDVIRGLLVKISRNINLVV